MTNPAAVGLASSIVTFQDVSGRVLNRLYQYHSTAIDPPEYLCDIARRLETVNELLRRQKREYDAAAAAHTSASASGGGPLPGADELARMASVVSICSSHAAQLGALIERLLPNAGDSAYRRTRKALSSLWREKEVLEAQQRLEREMKLLMLNFSPRLVAPVFAKTSTATAIPMRQSFDTGDDLKQLPLARKGGYFDSTNPPALTKDVGFDQRRGVDVKLVDASATAVSGGPAVGHMSASPGPFGNLAPFGSDTLGEPCNPSDSSDDDSTYWDCPTSASSLPSVGNIDLLQEFVTVLQQRTPQPHWQIVTADPAKAGERVNSLIRYYTRELRAQARNTLGIWAWRYVRRRTRLVADALCVPLSSRSSAATSGSVSGPRQPPHDRASDDSASDSSGEEIEPQTAPERDRLWKFLFDGPAFRALQQRLEVSALEYESALTRGQPAPLTSAMYVAAMRWVKAFVARREPGAESDRSTRFCWTCKTCGTKVYDDFLDTASHLHATHRPGAVSHAVEAAREAVANAIALISCAWSSCLSSVPQGLARRPSPGQGSNSRAEVGMCPVPQNANTGNEHDYLLLCIPHMRFAVKVQHADVCRLRSDQDFFRLLAHYYDGLRGRVRSWLTLKELKGLHFVQFEMYRNQLADVRQVPSVPPPERRADYEYQPMPPMFLPPVGPNVLMHLYEHPDHADSAMLLFRRVPKKRRCRLQACPVRGSEIGWGIQFVEGLNWHKLFLFCLLGFLLCSAIALAWAIPRKDVQGGFTIAAFLLAFMIFCGGALQAGLDKKA